MADLEGVLHKQRRGAASWLLGGSAWHKRIVRLERARGVLVWAGLEADAERKELALAGAVLTPSSEAEARLKRRFIVEVAAAGETVTFAADSEADQRKWAGAILDAARNGGGARRGSGAPTSPGSPTVTGGAGTPGASAASAASGEPAPDLPPVVYVDGNSLVGAELRVRVPRMRHQRALEPLGIQWYRLPAEARAKVAALCGGGAAPFTSSSNPSGDLLALVGPEGCKSIQGATAECYTLTAADAGRLLAVVVRSTAGPGTRWAVTARPCGAPAPGGSGDDDAAAAAADSVTNDAFAVQPGGPRVALALQPHEHSKYCDRRVRVCTAPGKYREGATVKAVFYADAAAPSGTPSGVVPPGYAVVWYRSDVVDDSQLVPEPQSATGALVLGGAAAASDTASSGNGGKAPLHVGTLAAAATSVAAALGDLAYRRVAPRPVSDLPPAPPDHVPSMRVPELKQRLSLLAQPRPASIGAIAGSGSSSEEGSGVAASASCEYPLFTDDVGTMLLAALVPVGSPVPDVIRPHARKRGAAAADVTAQQQPQGLPVVAPAAGSTAGGDASPSAAGGLPPLDSPTGGGGGGGVGGSPGATPGSGGKVQPRPPQRAKTLPSAAAGGGANAATSSDGDAVPRGMVVSPPVGAVEAAPPKARELWIDGTPAVGRQLVGRMYYYGGSEGASLVSWVAIDHEGETVVLKPPTPSTPPPGQEAQYGRAAATAAAESDDDAAGAAALPDDHPRALRLTPAHAGCLIKFKVTPVRSDGEVGHTESSRPTPEVAPASAAAAEGSS